LGKLNNKLLQKLAYWFEKRCYQASQAIVTCSQGMADDIRQRFGYQHVHVIPNASDNELFGKPQPNGQLPQWTQEKQIFLYSGTLGLMDNCSQLIEAAKVLQDRQLHDVCLAFLGDGQERDKLEALAHQYNLHNVHFLGQQPKSKVVGWLQKATAAFLVFKDVPVLHTSSPNKMFDAFAAGTPMIQTTQGWIKGLFEEAHCGLTVTPDSPTEMADAIQYMATHREEQETMAANAQCLAKAKFDRTKLAHDMLDIVVSVAN
jgi:glycosyltransferase involved in cell wall biosynthesis